MGDSPAALRCAMVSLLLEEKKMLQWFPGQGRGYTLDLVKRLHVWCDTHASPFVAVDGVGTVHDGLVALLNAEALAIAQGLMSIPTRAGPGGVPGGWS